jgi:hypothetical protein
LRAQSEYLKAFLNPSYIRMSRIVSTLTLFIFLIASHKLVGQAARTPFSSFGLGQPYGNALVHNKAMGGVGVSQPQYWFVNNQNPALLVFNYYTVFQAGIIIESRTVQNDTTNVKSVSGNLNYLVTAIPVKPGKWTSSIGLMPFTNKNYKLEYLDVVPNTNPQDTVYIVEQGSGGIAQLYWSNGVRLHDNWSVGLKAAYLFGSVNDDYTNTLITVQQPILYTISVKEQYYVRDFQFTGGLSFSQDSIGKRNEYRISAGLTYALGTNLRTQRSTLIERRSQTSTPISADTLVKVNGQVTLPSALVFGLSLSKQTNWSTGIEFGYQNWSDFRGVSEDRDQNLAESWRMAAGGEFTPDQYSDKIYKRITYRAGLFYEKSPFLINNNDLMDLGINFGLSVPAGRSSLDLAFSTGKRGDRSKNVLEESYFKVYFGVTFNDQWFIRRKFD